jgi:DnaJ like chaperone protein
MASKFSVNNLLNSFSKLLSDNEPVHKKAKKSPQQKVHDDEIQNAIIVLASAVIRCNRNNTEATETFIREFLITHFGSTGVKQKMEAINGHMDTGTEPLIKIACKELKMLATHGSHHTIITFLFGVAAVDDFINAKETRAIHRIAGYLGISDDDFRELKHHFTSDNNPFKVLGIDEDATPAQIRTAYRKMVLKYHPDKREAHVSEKEANLKFREIKRAYEVIKKSLPSGEI